MAAILSGLTLLGSASTHAADVSEYGVLKGKKYNQYEITTPVEASPSYLWSSYVRMSATGTVVSATGQPPDFPVALPLSVEQDAELLEFELPGPHTLEEFNGYCPNGDQVVTMTTVNDGIRSVALSLTGDTYPNTPTFLNVAALETVDPSQAVPLSWSAFSGGTSSDFIQLRVIRSGAVVFASPPVGATGALNGTATSVAIPADTLEPDTVYTLSLTFIKVTTLDTSSYADATGIAGYFKSTSSRLETTGGGGGGDVTPPELVSSDPPLGQFDVDVDSSVIFVFNEPMADAQSIEWSANVNPANFDYSWSGDGRTLTCAYADSLPETALVSWRLNPSGQAPGFEDVAGNPLPEDAYFGSFFTSSSGGPCGEDDDGRGAAGIIKELNYIQTSAADPAADPETPAFFFGSVASPTNDPVTSANLQVPGGPLLTLTNLTGFGSFFMASETYPSQSALDTARPNATYGLRLSRESGATPSANISLSGTYPPTPRIENFAACQVVDPAADFTVRWNGFSGASGDDHISLSILHPMSTWYWSAPDPCVPRELANTATSITIPSGTFEPGVTYEASLVYSRLTHGVSNAVPDIDAIGYLHKRVRFTIRTTGGAESGARFIGWNLLPNGNLELQLEGTVGRTYTIQSTDDLLKGWSTLSVKIIPPSGVAVFEVIPSAKQTFYRGDAL